MQTQTRPHPKPTQPGHHTSQQRAELTIQERLDLLDQLLALHEGIAQDEQLVMQTVMRRDEKKGRFNALLSGGVFASSGESVGTCPSCNYDHCQCERI